MAEGEHLSTSGATPDEGAFVTVVSGLPRSGTSMMMQMLATGGLPILSDGKRVADPDNPLGYLELEAATRLRSDTSFLSDAAGKGVKIVAQLLTSLPDSFRYRVVFLQREIGEVLASQDAMLKRGGHSTGSLAPDRLRAIFEAQVRSAFDWAELQSNVSVLHVNYAETLEAPRIAAEAVASFLGGVLNTSKMAAAVDPTLHRQGATRTPDVEVRRFLESDFEEVVAIWHAARKEVHTEIGIVAERDVTLEVSTQVFREVIIPGFELWVAVRERVPLGFLAIRGSYIDRLYVRPDRQWNEVGTILLAMARELSPGGLELHTHQKNHRARSFYEKHGFTAVAFGVSPPPENEPDVEYHWRPA